MKARLKKLAEGIGKAGRDAVKAAVAAFTAITLGGSVISIDGAADISLLQRGAISGLGAGVAVVLTKLAAWSSKP